MSEPLPCPFCGHTGIEIFEGSTFRWMVAECIECGARCGEIRVQTLGEGNPKLWDAQARVDTLAAWNTRVTVRENEAHG